MSAPQTAGTDFQYRDRYIKELSPRNTMFSSPPAKRIRRSAVFDEHDQDSAPSSSSSSDEEVTETTTIQEIQDSVGLAYHFDYDLIENEGGKITKFAHLQVDEAEAGSETAPVHKASSEDNAFEFRLFSTRRPPPAAVNTEDNKLSAAPKPASTRINIRSPTPDEPSDGRFLNPHRPRSYYFTSSTAPPSFASTAVSGLEVLNASHDAWPGVAVPWRVTHLTSPSSTSKGKTSHRTPISRSLPLRSTSTAPRRKPSKKRRIQLRTRTRLIDAKAKEKEEHLREKKTRLNRERKVKRREKEKAEKEKAEKEKAEKEKAEKEKAEKEKERAKASMMVEGVGVEV